jgi:hypothetical protein
MRIQIDQSIKVEDTGASVWAFANSEECAIVMPARVKRRALEIIRVGLRSRSRKIATFKLFAIGVFLVVEDFIP